MSNWIVAYDVPAGRGADRTALAGMLEAIGQRVLYSAFEIEASDSEIVRLVLRAQPLVGGGGAFLAQPWCTHCRQWRFGDPIETWKEPVVVW